ncbi:hypothetical protein [Pedobacter panaciterrae]
MLYYLFEYLNQNYEFPGLRLFQYITFRTSLAVIISLIITTVYGRRLINYLHKMQVGETVRNLGLEGQMQKQGTPTMGVLSSCWAYWCLHCCLPTLPIFM